MNLKLKAAIIERFGTQVAATRTLGISEATISRIVNGWKVAGDLERAALADALGPRVLKRVLPREK